MAATINWRQPILDASGKGSLNPFRFPLTFDNQHPIVEAKDIAYEDLFAIASGYGYTEGIYLSDMHLFVDAIRKDNRLKDKEVITYTYHWLLGMATATDSRGVTTTYTIDDFGRLSGIKDNNGYFIKKYTYKYNGL